MAEAALPRATGKAAASAALLGRGGGGNAKAGGSSSAATSRMDFDAVRRELFVPADSPVWPFPVRNNPLVLSVARFKGLRCASAGSPSCGNSWYAAYLPVFPGSSCAFIGPAALLRD